RRSTRTWWYTPMAPPGVLWQCLIGERVMLRAVLLVSLGLGFVGLPHTAWLLVLTLLLTAAFGLPDWRGGARRRPAPAGRLHPPTVLITPPGAPHFPHIANCDAQCTHPGRGSDCTQHWSLSCPRCVPPERRDEPRVA